MPDEGVIYAAGHPLLNRRCTRLPVLLNPNQSIIQSTEKSMMEQTIVYCVTMFTAHCESSDSEDEPEQTPEMEYNTAAGHGIHSFVHLLLHHEGSTVNEN